MAKQAGALPLRGTIGNITFYRASNGIYRARQKSSMNKDMIMNRPCFARLRERMPEFGEGSKASALFRKTASEIIGTNYDSSLHARLSGRFIKVTQSDTVNKRGERNVEDGDLGLLKGFQLGGQPLKNCFLVNWTASIDPTTSKAGIYIPGFKVSRMVVAPASATHFQFYAAAMGINFKERSAQFKMQSSAEIPVSKEMVPGMLLECGFQPGLGQHVFLLFGLRFYSETNGVFYPLLNRKENALEVVEVKCKI